MAGRIYVARAGAVVDINGRRHAIGHGTTVREGHELLSLLPGMFEPLVPDYEYTPPKPEPREREPRTRASKTSSSEERVPASGE